MAFLGQPAPALPLVEKLAGRQLQRARAARGGLPGLAAERSARARTLYWQLVGPRGHRARRWPAGTRTARRDSHPRAVRLCGDVLRDRVVPARVAGRADHPGSSPGSAVHDPPAAVRHGESLDVIAAALLEIW